MASTESVPEQPERPRPDWAITATEPGRGLGVASLVIGVASIVAGVSFVLFPLALIGGVVGAVLGGIALARQRPGSGTNGQALAGLICSVLALILAVTLTVRVGSWANENRRPLSRWGTCLAKANGDRAVRACFVQFVNEVRD